MNWVTTIIFIILGFIIAVSIFIGIIIFMMYAVAAGIGHKNEIEASTWDYWETMKCKRWRELSDEEKENMIIANMIIADDVGVVVTKEQLIKLLDEQLPITEPHIGLCYTHH